MVRRVHRKLSLLNIAMAHAVLHMPKSQSGKAIVSKEYLEPKEAPIPKGCQEFKFEHTTIVALNRKSAFKKYEKWKETNLTH